MKKFYSIVLALLITIVFTSGFYNNNFVSAKETTRDWELYLNRDSASGIRFADLAANVETTNNADNNKKEDDYDIFFWVIVGTIFGGTLLLIGGAVILITSIKKKK